MKRKILGLMLILAITVGSCKKEKNNNILIEGYVKDKSTKLGLVNINVYMELYKTGRGMGIIDGSRSDIIGTVLTDKNGYFTITAKLFKGAEAIKFIIYPINSSYSSKEIRRPLSELKSSDMPITFEYE